MTLMIAYATAGSRPLEQGGAPAEQQGSDPNDYVGVPLCVAMRYFWRAQDRAMTMSKNFGEALALSWLQQRDTQERTAWVELFRTSELTLGAVIDRVYKMRESVWIIDETKRALTPPPQLPKAKAKAGPPSMQDRGRGTDSYKATHLPNGVEICAAWNSPNGCNKPGCQKYHGCAMKLRNGRVCGLKNHTIVECLHRQRLGN